jgi:biopolymer transport protein ExbD
MNFRPHRKQDVDLNLTPLIDVVFLLLIFFMVSTTFERKSEINITLPQSSTEVAEIRPDAVTIAVDGQGRVYINEQPLVNAQLMTIREGIRDAIAGLTDPTVVINADADATHQSVIRIMDAARQLSLAKITFATRSDEEE